MPRKTKIGLEVANVTCNSDTTFKVKGQRSRSPGRFTHRRVGASGRCSGERGERIGREKLLLRCGLLGGARRFGAHRGRGGAGAYRGGRLPTACWFTVALLFVSASDQCAEQLTDVSRTWSLGAFKKFLNVILNQFITVYKSPCVLLCVVHSVCSFTFTVGVYLCLH